jgi:hypothetical protein
MPLENERAAPTCALHQAPCVAGPSKISMGTRWLDHHLSRLGMSRRRRRVFIETQKGLHSAGFTVDELADAADVSMALRSRGWIAYRLRLDPENHAWLAVVIDWQRAA